MVSFLAHMAVGILFAELILRLRTKDPNERAEKRISYWLIGMVAGLTPDLDVIPAILLGVHPYTFHHIFTHTFLAIGIVAVLCLVVFRKNQLALPFFAGFGMHLGVEFFDNSITPLGPFLPNMELGLLCGWGIMPGGWDSNFWTMAPYKNHYLWSIFLNNGWGLPFGDEFLSYYDLVLAGLFIGLLGLLTIFWFKRPQKNKKGTDPKLVGFWSFLSKRNSPFHFPNLLTCIYLSLSDSSSKLKYKGYSS